MYKIRQDLCTGCACCDCPHGAIVKNKNKMTINELCTACGFCLQACPVNAIVKQDLTQTPSSKHEYKDILVYVEHSRGKIASVTYELIGKALELANSVSQQVHCLFIGTEKDSGELENLLDYGVAKVYTYLHEEFAYFRADVYTNVFHDCVQRCRPTAVLVGASSVGRSLAPRIATRCHTGLTADCTGLSMRPNTDLVQTRPAFGGNIMAQIITKNHRPQFATVRAKVMDLPAKTAPSGVVEKIEIGSHLLKSNIALSNVRKKQQVEGIENAQVLVVAGSPIKTARDMEMLHELAQLLDGRVGATRPVIESGLADYSMQIGLSGRSVRPKLIITCGVSGAVQFTAGMNNAEYIFAINTNAEAPIMKIAHYAAVGDLFEIVPSLIKSIKGR